MIKFQGSWAYHMAHTCGFAGYLGLYLASEACSVRPWTHGFTVPNPQSSQQVGNFPVTPAAWELSSVIAASRHARPSV